MKTVEVEFDTILGSIKILEEKIKENRSIADQLLTIINGIDSSWEDLIKNSSTTYKENAKKYVEEMRNNINTIESLKNEISKAVEEYINNESEGSNAMESIRF